MFRATQNTQKGFTLLEILIVIGVFAVLLAFSAVPLLSFYRQIVLQGTVENVLAMLDEARKSTLSSYYSSQYGVHFESDKTVLFRGSTYSAMDPDNDEYTLNSNIVQVATITLNGGGSEVIFDRITGETSQSGVVEILLLTDPLSTSTITIHPSGLVEVD